MFELTPEQRHELGGPEPARAIDPETNETYVLIHVEVYERFKAAISDGDETLLRDMYPHVMQLFGRAGWDDPAMDVYNDLDPLRTMMVTRGDVVLLDYPYSGGTGASLKLALELP